MTLPTTAEALDLLATLAADTPGAGAAITRVLSGWECRSTVMANVCLAAALELRERGLDADATPQARLDAMAGLLALARASIPEERAPGNVRNVALLAASLIATACRPWGAPRTAPRHVGAAQYVLGSILASDARWTWGDPAEEERWWTAPVCPPLGPTDAPELTDARQAELERLTKDWTPKYGQERAAQSAAAILAARWGHEDARRAHVRTADAVLAIVRSRVSANGVHLSPPPSPTDERLAAVARSVASDADLAASTVLSEVPDVPAELARVHAEIVAGVRGQERAFRAEAEKGWREVSSARDRLRALAIPSVTAMTLPERREWWAAVEVAARALGPGDAGEAGTLLRAVERRDVHGAGAALRVAVDGWGPGYDLSGNAPSVVAPPVASPASDVATPVHTTAHKLEITDEIVKDPRKPGKRYLAVFVNGKRREDFAEGWREELGRARTGEKAGRRKDRRTRLLRWLKEAGLTTDLDALGHIPGLDP